MYKLLELLVCPDHDDATIRRRLDTVHDLIVLTLSHDPEVIERLADSDEFKTNVQREGENKVIELLRDTAKRTSWVDLFESRTSAMLHSSDIKRRSDLFLRLEIFFKTIPEDTEPISTASGDGA
jgi:hypothetical protein